MLLLNILKALAGKPPQKPARPKTKAQQEREKQELERKIWEMAEEYEEEE